jgi:hypothetical protein
MMIRHNPIFDTGKVIDHYSEKDGVSIIYVCTTELDEVQNIPVDVFYRETPHPEFENWYFGLYPSPMGNGILITNADSVENLALACVRDSKDDLHYSRYRHDCVTLDNGNMIDGGRAYVRTNNCDVFTYTVRNGIIVPHNETEANDNE